MTCQRLNDAEGSQVINGNDSSDRGAFAGNKFFYKNFSHFKFIQACFEFLFCISDRDIVVRYGKAGLFRGAQHA